MSSRHSRLVAPLFVLAMFSSYACDDNGETGPRANGFAPSPLSFNGLGPSPATSIDYFSRGVTFQPSAITAERIAASQCPTRPPFFAPIRVLVDGNERSDVFLNQVHMQFVDRTGIAGGSMIIGRRELVERFGSNRVPARRRRVFPFSFPFGCVGLPTGTLTLTVFAGDSLGREASTSAQLSVR
jgi:hypothetical protein